MKKLLQIPLLLVALFLTSIPISAHDFEVDGIYYNILTDSTVEVTFKGESFDSYFDEYSGEITVPSTVSRYSRTYSVTTIGNEAFSCCSGLASVTISNSVTTIGSSAFWSSSLTSVTIPNSVTSIGCYAFDDTPWYANRPKGVVYIGEILYGYKGTMSPGTSIEIKEGTISINCFAFSGCTSLASVTIPNSVTEIGYGAFWGCTSLASVTIPNSVTSIGESVFYGCTGLTSVSIPNSVTSIGYDAFSGCTGLTSVSIPNSVTSIGYGAFWGCTGLTSVTIPNSVTEIGKSAFWDCTGLTSVTIPNSVTSIGESAFSGCTGLTSVTIPNSVTEIGKSAFLYCSGLTSIISKSETPPTIHYNSFYGIYNTRLYVPFSSLDAYCAAENWSNFTNIMSMPIDGLNYSKISDTEVKVSGVAINVNNISIPYTITVNNNTYAITEIADFAFSDCTGLNSVTIPNSVTSIGESAFYSCTGLTSVSIPNSVTSIANYAFWGCNKLIDANVTATTQTTATINITSPTQYNLGLYYDDSDKKRAENGVVKFAGLSPNRTYGNYDLALIINGIYCRIKDFSFETSPFKVSLSKNGSSASSITVTGAYTEGDATILGEGINLGSNVSEFDGKNTIIVNNLDPSSSLTVYYAVKIQEGGGTYSTFGTFYTASLEMTTQEAKPTSKTSVRLLAATNCDATEGTGFEWRRYDAPDELPSSKVSSPVVDGVLVGSLRGVKDDVYYKYRPYYTSSSGNTYYGEWIAFFTGDANVYFEPDVRTYDDIQVINNSATVKGYALEGTDVITSQGFEYWKTGSTIKPASTDDRMTVSASGISMSATLANLEYNTTYKYRAFVTTAKGTVYGDEMEFSTGEDPSGIGYIEIDSDEFVVTLRENPATGTAWVKIAGAAGEEVQYTLTSMSGAMVANGTVLLDGEWNAIDLNCSAGMYLLTINDGTQVKTLRLIVK